MNSYILFIYSDFDDKEDVEYFLNDVVGLSKNIKNSKFIIDDFSNIIIIFESTLNHKDLSQEIYNLLVIDQVKFYFLFMREGLVVANLSPEIQQYFKLKQKSENNYELNIDDILDKIKKLGIESLTKEEKNFLDNFEN